MNNPTIGILGGMGPRATVEFEQRLLARFPGRDQDIPKIITINDGSVPDRTEYLLGKGNDPVPVLSSNAQILSDLGADVICVPCNTAHADQILGRFKDALPVEFIDMPEATIEHAAQNNHASMLVLCTQGTRKAEVFDSRAKGLIEIRYPNIREQYFISMLITKIKYGNEINSADIREATAIIDRADADCATLACTELSILKDRLNTIPVIDTLDALADACREKVEALYNTEARSTA